MADIPEGFSRVGVIGTYWHSKEWNEEEVYYLWNAVPYQGSSYLALKDNPIGPPTNDGENWIIIAKRGDDGAGGVTGIKGEAEGDEVEYHIGEVIVTKAMLGLENVENKSAAVILDELTKDQIEALLETPDLADILDAKADIDKFDSYTLQNVTAETLTTILQEVLDSKLDKEGAKEFLELDHVDNLSYEEIKAKLLEGGESGIIPEDIKAVTKFDAPSENVVYAAHEVDAETYPLRLAEDLEEVGYVFNETDKHAPLPENYDPQSDRATLLTPLMHMLKGGFYNWIIEQMLLDVHPVVGVRGEAEDKWNSDKVTITKESIGLGQVPDQHPDTFGVGFVFSGRTETAGDEEVKQVTVQDQFTLQDGRLCFITFMENNTAPNLQLDINGCGASPVNIRTFPVKDYNCETFQKYGNYLFQFDGTSWNFVTGSNDIIDVRNVRLEVEDWSYLEEDDVWMIEIELENLSGNEDLVVDVPLDLDDPDFEENFYLFQVANLLDGEATGHSLILYAQKKPRGAFNVLITVQP